MTQYSTPLQDYRFAFDVLDLGALANLPGFEGATPDLVEQVVEAAGRYAADVLMPLDRQSDEIGASFADGTVTAPPGFKACAPSRPARRGSMRES